ncbi:hypothetical protein SAMN05878295_102350 [Aeromonas hydrophila]|nr:hypothetical protein SAMN05880569_101350 [Aeromonas hydrophila]SIQ27047.1 hypothetical protein SAMN05878295_102350 [Aeromonas hydrophila]
MIILKEKVGIVFTLFKMVNLRLIIFSGFHTIFFLSLMQTMAIFYLV